MAAQKANINNKMLAWARKDADLSLDDAAQAAGVSALKDKSPAERLAEWENGVDQPTHNQLDKLAKAYFRPIITFYMSAPPKPNADVADFRTVADGSVGNPPPKLRALVSKMKARQQEILELLEDEEGNLPAPLSFVGRATNDRSVNLVARDIERELGIPLSVRTGFNKNDDFFRFLRNKIEELGVFVLAQGDLGNHHTDIDPKIFRGFALADPIAPFIVINDNDARPAQTFTLLHELAHIWIGDSGVSNYDPFNSGEGDDEEKFCNNVASEFLMPIEDFNRTWQQNKTLPLADAVAAVARVFSVSRAAAAHRLWRFTMIDDGQWWALYGAYKREWQARKDRLRDSDKPAMVYYPQKKSQLGRRFIGTVLGALEAGEITYTRASRILGVDPNGFDKLKGEGA